MAQPQVFLSHSSKDADFTRRLEADLRAAGAIVHIVSAQDGGNFVKRINDALAACEWVVLVLTGDALASPWVESEMEAAIRLARQGSIKNILPIQAGPVDYRSLPALLGNYNIFDATRDYPSARDALLRNLGLSAPAASPSALTVGARQVSPAQPVAPTTPAGTRDDSVVPTRLASLGFAGYRNGAVAYILPPLCSVPEGEFLMGSDPKRDNVADDDEMPQHRLNLPSFQLARFPLTVAEYACFVRSGHAEPIRWEYEGKVVDWQTQLQRLDHPVVRISWHDAVAYANWLALQTGQRWRLPSEVEWEKAARGRDGRIYPWGNSFDKTRCNTSEGGKGTTTPVGSYARGASSYGAQDMTGNVWEWTNSLFKQYPYTPADGRESINSSEGRVVRGGSWHFDSSGTRVACRDLGPPDLAGNDTGVRLALSVPGL